jgi:hypothetical protein
MVKQSSSISSSLFTTLPRKYQTKHFVELLMSGSPLFTLPSSLFNFVGSIGFKGNNKQISASIEITPKNFNSN